MEWSNTEIERYSRHLLLEEVGWEGVGRIRRGRVLLVGDVEPTALRYLAAAGVAHLALARPSGRLIAAASEIAGEGEIEILTSTLDPAQVDGYDAVALGGTGRAEVAPAWLAAHRPAVVAATTAVAAAVTTLTGDSGCPACIDLPPELPPAGPVAEALHGIAGTVVATEILKLLARVTPPLAGEILVVEANGRIDRRPLTRKPGCPICGGPPPPVLPAP